MDEHYKVVEAGPPRGFYGEAEIASRREENRKRYEPVREHPALAKRRELSDEFFAE